MSKNKKILFKAILYKSFVYLLIFCHLLWSSSNVLASGGLLVEKPSYEDDFHRSRFLHKTIQTEPLNVHHINLDKDVNGDFHINFDHLSSSAIIDYRCAGALIARVLVDQTNFILEGTSPHRLIIDSLIAREQLSCKSEGQIAFTKNIFVKSADIQSNGLHFMGNFTARDKSRISTGTMVANGTISSPYMWLTTKENAQFLGDIDTQLLNFSIGGNLDIGTKELAVAVQATDGMNISSKKLNNFGHLITDLGKIFLKVDKLQNAPNARIISERKLHLITREFFNEGVIQSKTTTHLKTKGFTNQGTINIEGDFQLDSSDFAENTGLITVIGTSKVIANRFSNTGKLTFGKESKFETESFLYNTGEFIFANILNLRAALVDNYGLMSVSNLFHLQGTNFKNFGKLQVEKNFGFSLQEDFFNDEKGHISIQGLASGTYKKLHNKGKWFAKGGFVSRGDHFINDRHATWQINNIWKNNSKNLTLGGHVSVEYLALLDVLENARLSGFLHVPALKISAQTSIECDPSTTLDVTHHLGFKATNFIDFDAQILSRSRASFEHSPFSKELAQYVSALPKGVFLTAGKHLRKAGKVVAEQGSVLMLSQGELKHVGFTESGFGEHDILQLNATAMLGVGGQLYSHNLLDIISDRSLEIESLASVRAANIRVHGKEDVNIRGRIQATKTITVNSERNLTFAESAKLDAEQNALLSAQENLNNRGKLRANGTLNLKSGWLLSNYGELSADNTTMRSKWVYNKAKVHADTQLDMGIDYGCLNLGQLDGRNTKINAGTFINLWDVNGQTSLKINSLANINANVLRGHNISTNSLLNYNFGLYLPTTPASWNDLVGWDTAITLTRNLSPTIGSAIGMAKSGMGLYKQGESLLKKLKDIRKGFIPASISEAIGLAADFKEFAVPALQFTRETGLASVAQNSCQAYQDGQFNQYLSDGYKGSMFATSQALSSAFLTLSNTPQNLTSYYQTASLGFPEGNVDHCASTLCSEIGTFGYQAFKNTQQVFYEGYQGYQAGTFDTYLQTRYQGIQEYANNHGASFVMPRVSTSSLFNRNSGKIYSGAISEQSLYSYNEGTIGAFGRYDSTTLFDYTEVGSVYGDQIGITSRGSILTGVQSHIYSRNSTTLDAQESVTHHGHILAHQGTATVRAKKDLLSATASIIKGQTAIVRAGSQATIEGRVDGKEKVNVFGAESTTVASSGFVIGEKERQVGMDTYVTVGSDGLLKIETAYSRKTDIQGQIQDTSSLTVNQSDSRTIIGGHVVDVDNHVQSHGITSIEATGKLTIGKAAHVSGDKGAYANGKDITHDGSFQSNEGTASLRAANGIKTAAHSSVEGKDGAHVHGKDVKHEGIVQSQEGVAIVTADKDLVTTTSSIIKGQLAIAKANGHALIEGIVDGKEKAQAFGMESTTLASSGSVIGEKERLVGMDSREMRDEEGQLLKDEIDNPKRETIYSKKTDIQGQVKDTSPSSSDRTNSRTIIGGHVVDVNNHVQSHGIISIEATDKLTIGKTGKIIGDKGAYVNGKDVTHDGDIQSKDGTASISAADNLTTTAGSVTEGQVTVLKAGEKANIKGKFKGSIFLVEAKGDVDLDANLEEKRLVRIGGQNVSVRGSHSSKGIKKSKEDKEEIGLIYQAREKLTIDVTAVAEEDIVVSAKVVETRGNYSAKKISLIGEDYLDNYAKVRASEMLSVRSNWLFSNYGELSSDNTIVRSKWLYNEGTIQADTQLDMGIDYGCLNFGYLDSRNTKINAGAFINLWDVKGQSSLRVNSLVNINVGLMRGHSIATNSLVSLNLGLYLPTIPASWTDLFSWDTAVTIARNFNPCMGSVAGAAKTGYSLVRQGGQIVDKLKGMKSGAIAVSVSEIIGLVADGKEFATSGLQFTHETGLDTVAQNGCQALQDGTFGQYVSDTYKSAESIVSSSAKRSLNSLTTYCDAATTVYQEGNFGQYALAPAQSMRDFGSQLISDGNQAYQAGKLDSYLQTTYQNAKSFANDNGASFIMPHVNTSSLFSYNGGKIYSGSVSEQSLYSYNHGVIEAFGRYDSTSLLGFTNAGSIYGDQIGIKSSGSIVTEAQSHIYSRKSATLHAEKSITHQGHLQSLQGTASVYGAERTLIGRESSAEGKQVYIGKTVQSSLAEDGTEVIEILHSKITETAEGAGLKGENIQIAGDKLSSAAKINARTVSFESKDGEILNPQDIQASEAYVALGHYNGGGQGALDLANKMLHVPTVVMDAHQEDFVNEETLKIHGDYRSFVFKTVDNSAPIDATGKLILDGIQNFRTTADISVATGLYTISSKGSHETLNGAVLATKQGITHVEGALGLTLQSVLLDDNIVKRAGYVGDRVERVTNGVFDNTAGQTIADEIVSLIGGNQTDRVLACANNSTSLNADGSKSILQGGKRATQTYARTEDLSDYTSEKIKGTLTTEAGIRRANKGGSTFVEGGIEAVTLHHTYEAEKGYKKSGLFNQHKEEWIREDTDFYVPEVHSSQGNFDFISSAESRLEAILYNVAKTSDVGGRGNAAFTASVVRNYYQGSGSRWWGLGKKRYEGYEDCAQVAHLLGQEKINIISGREPALFESTIIDVAQGGGIYSPKGIMSQPVILEASFVERRQGIGLSCFANRSFESIHPVAHRIASLAANRDGISGAVSDLGGLTTSLFNSTTHAAQTYNMRGSFLEYSLSEVGMGKISLGYNDTQTNNHAKQSLPGFIYSGGEFVIQTDSGYEADLSGMNTKIKTLCLDTDRLKLGGTLQTSHHQEKTYSAVLLFDILHPTVITVSADRHNSSIDGITHTQTHHEIDQLHLLYQDTKIDLQNADLAIGKSSGETYLININDEQNYTHTKGHHEGFSMSIDMTTGLPIGGGVSAGYTDIHSYTTPYRSKVRIGEGDNFQGIIETQQPDKIKGKELSVFYQQMSSSQDEALSMPLTVSGQIGSTRFRAEPIFVKRDALARDISTIQRAGQLVVENFNRQQTREDLRERLLTECMSEGLLEKEASEISESIVAAYDQVHAAKDKNGFSQPRILDEEGPVFISKHGELSGEETQKLRYMLQERQMQLSEETRSDKLEHDNFKQHIEELTPPTIRESEAVSVTQTLGEESEFDIERDQEIGSNITSKDPLTSIDVATFTSEKMVEDITAAAVVEEQDWYGCIEDTSLRKFVGFIQEFGSEVGNIGEHAKEIVQSEHPIFGENSSWEGLSPLEKAFRIRMENEYKEDALTAMIFDAALKVSFDAVLKVGNTLSWPYRTFIAPTVESNTHALGNKIAKTLHQQAGVSKSAAQDIGEGIEYSLNFASEYTVNLGIIKGINKVSQLNRTTTIAALDLAKTSPVCCEYTSCNNHLQFLEKKLIIDGQQAQLLKGKFDIIAGNGTTKSIRDAPRLANQHGGNVSDWAKIKSYNEALSNGKTLELHAYMNVKTRKIVEIKPKVQ